MQFLKIFMIILAVLYLIAFIYFLYKTKKPLKMFLIQIAIVTFLIAVIKLTSFATGLEYPLNYGTVAAASLGGIPGMVGILLLNKIFML